MFHKLKQINIIKYINIQTNIRNYVRKANRNQPNPGIQRQIMASEETEGGGAAAAEDPEAFGDYESDFFEINKSHKEYEKDLKYHKEKIKRRMIDNKYFKIKQYNFLTWSEKQQIRYLNENDPDEWTIERLSESFPVTSDIIIKILKAKWYPDDVQRVIKHDEVVRKNWELFRNKKLSNIDKSLTEHLQKFSEREWTTTKERSQLNQLKINKRITLPLPKSTEFVNIITSCDKYKEEKIDNDDNDVADVVVGDDTAIEQVRSLTTRNFNDPNTTNKITDTTTVNKISEKLKHKQMFLLDNVKENKKLITFKDLQLTNQEMKGIQLSNNTNSYQQRNSNSTSVVGNVTDPQRVDTSNSNEILEDIKMKNENSSHNMSTSNKFTKMQNLRTSNQLIQNPNGTGIVKKHTYNNNDTIDNINNNENIMVKKYENFEIQLDRDDFMEITMPSLRERIKISKKLYKKGATYKLEDCYYDDDGTFLYRTPGMVE